MRRTTVPFGLAAVATFLLAAAIGAAEPPPTTPTETVRGAAERAERERGRQAQAPGGKDWSVGLFTGVQYDDNVLLLDKHRHQDNESDWKSVNALFADYRLINSDERVLAVRYGAYQTFLDKQNDLQLTGNSLTLRHTEILAPVVIDVPVSFTHYDLDGDKFLNLTSAAPALFLQESPQLIGVLRTGYRRFEYYDVPGSGFHEPDRTSDVWEAGLEQWLLLGDDGRWRLEAGWTFRHEDARQNEWSSDAGEARLGLRGELPWRLGLETSVTYTDRGFDEQNQLFGKTERDRVTACGLALSRPIWSQATASISYLFTNHESNVDSQDYRRNQVTLGVIFLF